MPIGIILGSRAPQLHYWFFFPTPSCIWVPPCLQGKWAPHPLLPPQSHEKHFYSSLYSCFNWITIQNGMDGSLWITISQRIFCNAPIKSISVALYLFLNLILYVADNFLLNISLHSVTEFLQNILIHFLISNIWFFSKRKGAWQVVSGSRMMTTHGVHAHGVQAPKAPTIPCTTHWL